MKSAYDLAMERLAKSDPAAGRALTPAQKARLAELDLIYKGKIAEREIFLREKLNETLAAGKYEEIEKIRTQLAAERTRLEEERDDEKEKVRRERR
jgi:hypothetical protein